jgi:branched-chain amino acid aminotransferase
MASKRVVWWNGDLIPESEARLSIYDSALMFGDMVFEMTRSFNKKQFKTREHIDRLYASAKSISLDIPISKAEMEAAIDATVEANDPIFEADDEHRLIIDVTRGLLGIYAGNVDVATGTNVIIADFPLRWTVAGMGKLFDEGINVVVPSQRTIPAQLLDPKVKNRSRMHYLMANIQASKHVGSNNWALLLDPDGFVAEGTGSNFFTVSRGTLYTPEGRNVLRGISRDYVFELAAELGLPCKERNLEVYDVVNADEAFMTGTPFAILPVIGIEGSPIGDGRPGPLTKRLTGQWSKNVGLDIVAQIKGWDKARGAPSPTRAPTPYEFGGRQGVREDGPRTPPRSRPGGR